MNPERPVPSLLDGELTVTYVEAENVVELSLDTVREQRGGSVSDTLEVAFTDEPGTPPARIAFRLGHDRSVPAHVDFLVGPRLRAAIDQVVAGPRRTAWLDLSAPELTELAEGWAPYRNVVERPAWSTPAWQQPAGRVSGRMRALWTLLSGAQPAYRSAAGIDGGVAQGEWILPEDLARAAGVDPRVTWTIRRRSSGAGVLDVRAAPAGEGHPTAIVELNTHAADGIWTAFAPDGSGDLVAALDLAGERTDPGVLSLRVRQSPGASD